MGTSPDVGGRQGIGRPLQPEYHELEATAQVQIAKAGLGIVPNTLDISFTQLGGNVWKYQASSTKPEMTMNVLTALSYPDAKAASQAEMKQYNRLLEELPLKLGLELKNQNRKPIEDRDSTFLVFEKILKFAAKALAWLDSAKDIDPEAFVEISSKNRILPIQMMQGWMDVAEGYLQEWKLLSQALAHDIGNRQILNDNIRILEPLIMEVKNILSKEVSIEPRAMLNLFTRALALQNNMLEGRISNALGALKSLVDSILPLASALTLGEKGPMFLALSFGTAGLSSYGKASKTLIQAISQGFDDIPAPQQMLIQSFMKALILLFVTIVSEAGGLVSAANQENNTLAMRQQKDAILSLTCKLASTLLTSCGLLPIIAQNIMPSLTGNKGNQALLKEAASLLAMNCLIIAGAKGNKMMKSADPLLGGMRTAIHQSIVHLKDLESSMESRELAAAIRQADLALNKGDVTGYFEAVKPLLKAMQMTMDSLQTESEPILGFVLALLPACYHMEEQNKFASVVSQAA